MYAREISPPVRISLLVVTLVSLGICSELKVRVRLSDGLIGEEILDANSENDDITVEFKQGDGTHITAVFDFKRVSELNILKCKYLQQFQNTVICCILCSYQ